MREKLLIGLIALSVSGCARQDSPTATQDAGATAAPSAASAPAPSQPADSGLAIKRGVMMVAQDRRTFRPCEADLELWVLDQTDGVLAQAFESGARTTPLMLYVEAYGERTDVTEEDPAEARGYAGVFVLEEVLYAGLQEESRGCAASPPAYAVAARGTEPFWTAEVHDAQLIWRQPDAPREVVLSAPQMEDAEGAVRYRAADAEHAIEVMIESQPCRDSMSGEYFAYSARAEFDGREFSGCARLGR